MKPRLRIPGPVLWLVLAVAAFTAGVALFDWVLMPRLTHRGQDARVPDLGSLPQSQAEQVAGQAGFLLRVRMQQFDAALPRGCVLSQDPPPGVMGRRGRAIEVVLSLGEEKATIPPLGGQDFREAQVTLGGLGLTPGSVSRIYSDDVPADHVVASDPGPDSPIPQDRPVRLLLSLGPEPRRYLLPDWVGTPVREVSQELARAGLRSSLSGRDAALAGAVVSQSPPPGSLVRSGDLVTLGTGRGR
ncbi:MAG TPA: PASTA domain-containing protein [Candidatus Saccharimonadales bacterium]|nr:PASTA domain-containing protein [Candidatus Saccharimonadales bacterium]